MVAVLGYTREQIIHAVQTMYTSVARAPSTGFHFPVGRSAAEALGYPRTDLDRVPDGIQDSFAGVGYPFTADAVRPGDTVLDVGAGAGVDSVIAAHRAGPSGRVIAVDLTPAMATKLRRDAPTSVGPIHALAASAEHLPLTDASVDTVTSNGALNLVPDKRRAVTEMFRVLRPGGRLQIADVVIQRPVTVDCDSDPRLWVECVVGATVDEELLHLFRDAGFEAVEVVGSHDYFDLSPSAQTREIASAFGAYSVELGMHRPARAPSRLWQWARRCSPVRLARAVWRRGAAGALALVLALLACYGTVAALALLPLVGLSVALNEGLWAGSITALALLCAAALGASARHHRYWPPALISVAGAALITYTMLVDYNPVLEASGFLVLGGGVTWDFLQRRRRQTRVLGLDGG